MTATIDTRPQGANPFDPDADDLRPRTTHLHLEQLATYGGWMLHGWRGGLLAGGSLLICS